MHYVYLGIAILAEVCATTGLKASAGFSRLVPTLIALGGYTIAFFCLSLTLRVVPVGIAYAIWSGAGICLIALAGWLLYGEVMDMPAVAGAALIIAGIVVMTTLSDTVKP
ncbi:MAG: multidrug efflux SMR transporter [Novosphingobium sp.]|nr:multidrug efflux SMR transporter [Novosphingobium sp.]